MRTIIRNSTAIRHKNKQKLLTTRLKHLLQRQQVLPKKNCDNLKTAKVRTPHFYITLKKDVPESPIFDYHASNIKQNLTIHTGLFRAP